MYAIISLQGHQFRVEPGVTLDVDRLVGEPGETLTLDDSVLAAKDQDELKTGSPTLAGARVILEILEHIRGDKLTVFKMKRRKRYRRKSGHRQELTRVLVKDIELP